MLILQRQTAPVSHKRSLDNQVRQAARQDQADRLAFFRADRAEDVGRGGALVARGRGPRSPLGPTPGDLVLLSDARLIGEPHFYGAGIDALFARDFLQAGRETFLKSSIAFAACA